MKACWNRRIERQYCSRRGTAYEQDAMSRCGDALLQPVFAMRCDAMRGVEGWRWSGSGELIDGYAAPPWAGAMPICVASLHTFPAAVAWKRLYADRRWWLPSPSQENSLLRRRGSRAASRDGDLLVRTLWRP
jgi:hypothetical protein